MVIDPTVSVMRRTLQLEDFLKKFVYTTDYLKQFSGHVNDELSGGFRLHSSLVRNPSLKDEHTNNEFECLDTFISHLPSGNETGIVYGIDIGGSYIRIVRLTLEGQGQCEAEINKYNMRDPRNGFKKGLLDKACPASHFFDCIAKALKDLMTTFGDLERQITVGMTFPVPVEMNGLKHAIVMDDLCKEFETGRETDDVLVGINVVEMLSKSISKVGLHSVEVTGCLNDTACTLVAAAYKAQQHPLLPCARIGMIIGHGFNMCLMDKDALKYGYSGSVINLEAANLLSREHIIDKFMDATSSNPGRHLCEKKVGATYLGELVRFGILRVLESDAPPEMYEPWSLSFEQSGRIFNAYRTYNTVDVVNEVMEEAYEWTPLYAEISRIISEIVFAVWDRSAAIVAACISGASIKTGRLKASVGGVTIGVDGTLYSQYPVYQKRVRKHLRAILGEMHKLVHILISRNSAGKGAAMLGLHLTNCS